MPPPRGASHRRHWPPWRVSTPPMRKAAAAPPPLGPPPIPPGQEPPPPGPPRPLRRGVGQWRDPVHEELVVDGKLGGIAHGTTMWVHRKSTKPEPPDRARNMRLLLAWLEREPDNPRALHYAGREEAAHGSDADAVCYFRRFFAHYPVWDELSAQVHRHLALSLIRLGRVEEAAEDARAVVAAMPGWPDSYLTLAECALEVGDAAGAIEN